MRLVLGAAAIALLVLASLPGEAALPMEGIGACLAGGFAALGLAVGLPPRRLVAPAGLAAGFAVLGGISALLTAIEGPSTTAAGAGAGSSSFAYAARVTAVAGVAAVLGALALGRFAGRAAVRHVDIAPARVARFGQLLVAIGLLGLAAALLRFAAVELPTADLWGSIKSFWRGNSYFLLVASFAIPGFGLWLHAAFLGRSSRRGWYALVALAGLFVAAVAPTGQRGFVIQLALAATAVLLAVGRLRVRSLVVIVAVGVVLLGFTQALRNEIVETGTVDPGRVVTRLEPDRWTTLYGSQVASFRWTWDVAAYRDALDIPNTFLHAVLKPVPRQLLPNKVQGFGDEFTAQLYPEAHAREVGFATPLVAESDYVFGPTGVALIFFVLGALLSSAELYAARGAPRLLAPLNAAAVAWTGFVLVRGDLANALFVASIWIVPLAAASLYFGFRPLRRGNKIVIDALQVPAQFSGVGRRVLAIGEDLRGRLMRPLEVRSASDVVSTLRGTFPDDTEFRIPLRSSRPRLLRLLYQQVVAPALDPRSALLVCPGDQAPIWGRARVLLVLHDVRRLVDPRSSGRVEGGFYRLVVPRSIRRATTVVTVSHFSKDEIRRALGDRVDVRVVADHPPPRVERASEGRAGQPLLGVGALRKYKGAETVVEALSLLEEDGRPDVVWVGTGEGRRAELARYAEKLGVAGRIRFSGWVDEPELDRLYRECFATVNPSTYEGYGLPVAESLAYGRPTIASDIPSHREVAGDAALYFEPGDPRSLARTIARFREDRRLREELAHKALQRSHALARAGPSWGEVILEAAEEAR